MLPALYNIVLILFHSDICVDFLDTHMISLVLFFGKPGVTRRLLRSTAAVPRVGAAGASPNRPSISSYMFLVIAFFQRELL
jgi:hypothetical protein